MMKTPDCKDVKCRFPVGVDARIDPRADASIRPYNQPAITKNPAGLPLLTVTYTYNDHVVGSARYYQTRLLSDQLL